MADHPRPDDIHRQDDVHDKSRSPKDWIRKDGEMLHQKKQHLIVKYSLNQQMKDLKKMGWYWGSIGPGFACKLLEFEPDGTFLVRDSSSECYIFSMTFKLQGKIHHSRIEHKNGSYSFSGNLRFFCRTIKDFIEKAIENSHNGNFIFFLHREPSSQGPVRFRMRPLSRLKNRTSLKHLCRFAILPYVKKDKIGDLSIPECLKLYLYEPFQQEHEQQVK